ncbi:MAG: hypothetical protein CM15mP58_22850 [Burkholderiaceae bacterium]|nr:MAG: hypothetical protein CM15mP58_22850 [Burkholderiaceae bacterium]
MLPRKFFNTYEIILNISDQINGFISARSWGYHGLEGKFLDAKIKKKNTINLLYHIRWGF